jgi:hypothetical protein
MRETVKELWGIEAIEALGENGLELIGKNISTFTVTFGFYGAGELSRVVNDELEAFREIQGNCLAANKPKVGDYISVNGQMKRIAYIWGRKDGKVDAQTTGGMGSFYTRNGESFSMSGSLEPSKVYRLERKSQTKRGDCWHFLENSAGAGRGVTHEIEFPVWEALEVCESSY